MTYLILITTPFEWKKPLTWWKRLKRKIVKKDYDTVVYSQEIDNKIYVFESTFLGYVKQIDLKEWKKSKLPSKIIPITNAKTKL